MARVGGKKLLFLVAYCTLALYTYVTVLYHAADVALALDPERSNPLTATTAKFRAGLECRDYVAETGDESCYSKWIT
jgi:hypothetical protein